MSDMKEKAMGAVKAFLERKGYEIVDEAWQGPEGIGGIDLVAVDEDGTLVCFAILIFRFSQLIFFGFHVLRQRRAANFP